MIKPGLFSLFLILCNCLFQSAYGQITISDSSAPNSAENIIYTISNRSIDTSVTGPNTSWDFSGIVPTAQDTYKFLAPKDINSAYTTVYNGDLGLDLKNPNVNGSFAFFKNSSSDFRTVGIGITVPIINLATPMPYKSPDIVYRFPMKYGNIDSCYYGGRISLFGMNASVTGKRVDTVDGWGTVKTPYKTYKCLRIKSVITETDTIGSTVVSNNSVQYKWISATEHIPVFEVDAIANGQGGTSTTIKYRDTYKNFENPDGPYVDFIANDTNVFVKDTVRFYDKTVAKLSSWLWTILPITYSYVDGTKNSSQNPVVVFNDTGTYTISLRGMIPSGGGNTKVKLHYITIAHNSSINQTFYPRELKLFPNPATGLVSIQFDKILINNNLQIVVINSTAQEIYNQFFVSNGDQMVLDLSKYSKGLYFIKMQCENQIYTGKVDLQ